MKQVRKNGAGIHISAGLSGYIACMAEAKLCAEFGMDVELHDNHVAYLAHWVAILKGDKTAIIQAAAKADQAIKWLKDNTRGAVAQAA